MGVAALVATESKSSSLRKASAFGMKASFFRTALKHVLANWQGMCSDREQLWRVYDQSAYAHSMPKCVWRRHGALLMYAHEYKRRQRQ